MRIRRLLFSFAFFACFAALFSACQETRFSTDPSLRIAFSRDTVSFDTLFTTIPSHTATVLIYNRNSAPLTISTVEMAGGDASLFRFNLDGRVPASNRLTNVPIGANDSLFLFIETTLSGTSDSLPIYFDDQLNFTINGQTQSLQLESYGKNSTIFRSTQLTTNTTLTAERPYLIFGYLYVGEGATLTIEPGAELYFHKNAHLIVDGNLKVDGSFAQPVTMRCDRFDTSSDGIPVAYYSNQWGNIYLQNPNGQHTISNAVIRGGAMGILLIGAARQEPTLTIRNSIIQNMGSYGVYAQKGQLTIENSEISNCGISCISVLGGTTSIAQSTIANYYEFGTRSTPAVKVANYVVVDKVRYLYPIDAFSMENSIVFGSRDNEVTLDRDTVTNALFNVVFSQNLIKGKKQENAFFQSNNLWSFAQNPVAGIALIDTVFINTSIANLREQGYYNFQLDPKSRARNRANSVVAAKYPLDLLGKNRLVDSQPDLGAYER